MKTIIKLWVLGLMFSGQVLDAKPPNVVMIEVDDLTYQYIGAFGSKTAKTPTMDRLAAQGFLFTQAMCQGTMCGPSRNSLMTGKYPHQLGFYQNGDLKMLPKDSWSLSGAMKRAGYETVWIGKSHLKPWSAKKKEDGFNAFFGFDYSLHTLGRQMLGGEEDGKGEIGENPYTEYLKSKNLWEKFQAEANAKKNSTLAEDDYLDGWFARNTVEYLNRYQKQKPLFMWVNFSLPHGPYDVPDEYHVPFAKLEMPGVTEPKNYEIPDSLIERTKRIRSVEKSIEDQRGYSSGIAYLDRQIKRIMDALERKGMLDDTWIIFFSDQGMMQGSLGLLHKHTLFRQITQPALMIRPPKGGAAKVIDEPVELLDLLPTVLEIAGSKETAPTGVSMQGLLGGKAGVRKYSFAEIEKWVVVSDGTYRLLKELGTGKVLLFHDRKDPENRVNIADQEPERVKQLNLALEDWMAKTGERKAPRTY